MRSTTLKPPSSHHLKKRRGGSWYRKNSFACANTPVLAQDNFGSGAGVNHVTHTALQGFEFPKRQKLQGLKCQQIGTSMTSKNSTWCLKVANLDVRLVLGI